MIEPVFGEMEFNASNFLTTRQRPPSAPSAASGGKRRVG
jgi:hypothetical protein